MAGSTVRSIAVLALVVLAGCGSGVGRADLVEAFESNNPDMTTEQAGCVADRLLERYEPDELRTELEADAVSSDFEEAQFRDMFACGVEGDVREQITSQLQANGVDADYAPCVSDELVSDLTDGDIDVLLSGEITDSFYEKFFTAMDTCGAVNP